MCECFCMGLIDFMLARKKLIDFTNMFSPHDFKKNDDIILSYFKDESNSIESIAEQIWLNKQKLDQIK